MAIRFELPFEALEPLFTALSIIRPDNSTKVEQKAIGLLRSAIYFELEKHYIQTEEEATEAQIDFQALFEEERLKRKKGIFEKEEQEV
jgi:hypothetical protein